LEAFQGNPSIRVELHTLDLEPDALLHVPFRDYLTEAEPTVRVDHPVPRHTRLLRQRIQGVTYLPRVPDESRECGYLTVGSNAAGRDPADDCIDAFVSAFDFHYAPPADALQSAISRD
jgi:hypothetical protein